MDPISMILLAVRGLSVVVSNPALGGGSSLKMNEISEFLGMLGELIERGNEGHEELKRFAETIDQMVAENRAPTPKEWDILRGRSDAAHAVIQRAAAEVAEPEPEPEPEPPAIDPADPLDSEEEI
ncbi:hypothetical protein [[Eubacterium] cellulosolvens]